MKLIKILVAVLILVPTVAFARGFLVPVHPTASITIGGQQSYIVTTGEKIPVIRWKSTNGTSFRSYFTVNNSGLCNGIKDNQVWGQANTAGGSFDLGNAPKVREGCVLTINYEATSRTGHKAVSRAFLRYVAPKVVPPLVRPPVVPPVTPPVVTPKEDLSIKFLEVGGGDKVFPGSLISTTWSAKGLKPTDEVRIYVERADRGPIKGESSRIHPTARYFTLEIPKSAEYGKHIIVIGVIREGDMIQTFESEPFIVYGNPIDDGGIIVGTSTTQFSFEFNAGGSVANNDENTNRDYTFSLDITPAQDIFIPSSYLDPAINYQIVGSGSSTSFANFNSDADEVVASTSRGYFYIPANETKTLTGVVTISNVSRSGQYRIQLEGLNYYTSLNNPVHYNYKFGTSTNNFRTNYYTINSGSWSQSFFQKVVHTANPLNGLSAIGVGFLKIIGLW